MRIVTWNCKMGFDKKADELLSLNPDIAVIPECSENAAFALRQRGYEALWFGSNSVKAGLGVFCRKGWSMRVLSQPQQEWVVPIEIDGPVPFRLLAVWACRVGNSKASNYIGQVYQALIAHPQWFEGRPVALAGDLNSSKIWDAERKIGNHSEVVKILENHGVVSGYHEYFDEAQGLEKRPTFHLYHHAHRQYHIDYVFIPREWVPRLKTVEVGSHAKWSKLSDHCPMIVDIE